MGLRTILARNLKAARLERGLSQEELAHEAGLHRTYISLLENEHYSASIDTLEKLAAVLRVEAIDLLRAK